MPFMSCRTYFKRRGRLFLLPWLLLFPAILGQTQTVTEEQLKAAYLVNFLKYIEWPAASVRPTFNICLFGRDILGPYLAVYEGRSISGREIRIRRVSSAEQMNDCHEVFVPDTEEARLGVVLRWSEKWPVLTVSDSDVFVREGGAVGLVTSAGRLQFDVNLDALHRAGLKPSSQLMRLARRTVGGGK